MNLIMFSEETYMIAMGFDAVRDRVLDFQLEFTISSPIAAHSNSHFVLSQQK